MRVADWHARKPPFHAAHRHGGIGFSALFAELAAAHIALASVALYAVFFVPAPWRRVAKWSVQAGEMLIRQTREIIGLGRLMSQRLAASASLSDCRIGFILTVLAPIRRWAS